MLANILFQISNILTILHIFYNLRDNEGDYIIPHKLKDISEMQWPLEVTPHKLFFS